MRLEVERTRELPVEQLEPLFTESAAEGWRHLTRLHEGWQQGLNRFDRRGDALYLARDRNCILAVGGVNQDPYAASPRIGRVRRVHVLAASRRRGVGRTLLNRIVRDAPHAELRLRATNPDSAAFFEALGFEATTRFAEASHRLVLP